MASVSRVLMTVDARGGVWTYALELAGGLGSRGVDVLLAAMGGGVTEAKRSEAARLPNVRLRASEHKLEWMESPWEDVARAGDWLLQIADEFSPDIVHLNGYAHAALPWGVPVIAVAHSCVLSWFSAVLRQKAPPAWDRYRIAVQRGLEAADLLIAPSRFMLREIERHYGTPSHAQVIYNGRTPDLFRPGAKEPFILSAGRLWDEAKNIQVFAEAASQLDWPVFVAGEGGADLPPGVRGLGLLNPAEIADWYSRAAIYAHPALYEPFGLAVLEAALSGCALVLSDIPSLREIWGDAAVYVDPRNPEQWRKALNRLARSPLPAGTARVRALALTTASMTGKYLDAYHRAQQNQSCASHSSVIRSAPTGITATPISSVA